MCVKSTSTILLSFLSTEPQKSNLLPTLNKKPIKKTQIKKKESFKKRVLKIRKEWLRIYSFIHSCNFNNGLLLLLFETFPVSSEAKIFFLYKSSLKLQLFFFTNIFFFIMKSCGV